MGMVRLQKVLRDAGLGSRRRCEELITMGRVEVNGNIYNELGVKVDPRCDKIVLDGRPLRLQPLKYIMANKPSGYACTSSLAEGFKRTIDLVGDIGVQLHTVGRLDVDSEGLILLTNDGEMTHALTHPSFRIPKTYRVIVRGAVTDQQMESLRKVTHLAEGPAQADRVNIIHRDRQQTVLEVVLIEGRNREIRRMLARLALKVKKLKRIQFGPLSLRGLATGAVRLLKKTEITQLREWIAKRGNPRPKPYKRKRK